MRAPVVCQHKEVRTTVVPYSFLLLLEAARALPYFLIYIHFHTNLPLLALKRRLETCLIGKAATLTTSSLLKANQNCNVPLIGLKMARQFFTA